MRLSKEARLVVSEPGDMATGAVMLISELPPAGALLLPKMKLAILPEWKNVLQWLGGGLVALVVLRRMQVLGADLRSFFWRAQMRQVYARKRKQQAAAIAAVDVAPRSAEDSRSGLSVSGPDSRL